MLPLGHALKNKSSIYQFDDDHDEFLSALPAMGGDWAGSPTFNRQHTRSVEMANVGNEANGSACRFSSAPLGHTGPWASQPSARQLQAGCPQGDLQRMDLPNLHSCYNWATSQPPMSSARIGDAGLANLGPQPTAWHPTQHNVSTGMWESRSTAVASAIDLPWPWCRAQPAQPRPAQDPAPAMGHVMPCGLGGLSRGPQISQGRFLGAQLRDEQLLAEIETTPWPNYTTPFSTTAAVAAAPWPGHASNTAAIYGNTAGLAPAQCTAAAAAGTAAVVGTHALASVPPPTPVPHFCGHASAPPLQLVPDASAGFGAPRCVKSDVAPPAPTSPVLPPVSAASAALAASRNLAAVNAELATQSCSGVPPKLPQLFMSDCFVSLLAAETQATAEVAAPSSFRPAHSGGVTPVPTPPAPDAATAVAAAPSRAVASSGNGDAEHEMKDAGGDVAPALDDGARGGAAAGCAPAVKGARSGGRVSLDALRAMFDLPVQEVVRALGISATDLKRRCRALGILRWPQRKLLSLRRLAEAVEADRDLSTEERLQMLSRVARNRADILADPDAELEACLKPLRQAHYKRNFVDRRTGNRG